MDKIAADPILYQLTTSSMDKVIVTCVRNILDPYESRESACLAIGGTLKSYLDHFFPDSWGEDYELIVSENGHVLETYDLERIITSPTNITFAITPQGGGGGGGGAGKIVAAVGMVALAIATYGTAIGATGAYMSAFGYTMTASMSTIALVGAGLVALGVGMMSYNIAMDAFAEMKKDSVTYSWDNAKNYSREGGTWPVLYGTMRITPPILAKTTTVNGTAQTLNVLYCVADHACDSLTLTEINETPYADFDGNVTLTTDRLGSIDQTVVPGFLDTISEVQVATKLTTSYTTRRTTGDSLNAIAVEFVLPRGLFHVADNGNLESHALEFVIEYKLAGDSNYTVWDTIYLADATSTPLRYYYRKDGLTVGQYDIRVKFTTQPATGTRYASDVYWEMFQEIVYDDFAYPGATLLGVHSLNCESLNGSIPKVTVVAARSTVQVWTGSAYESKPANNPAWACYDMLHNASYGADIPYTRIDYAAFLAWATFCSTNSYTCNIYFDVVSNMRRAIDTVSLLGRGHVVQKGSKYSVIVDQAASAPVQGFLFTQANMVEDSFTQEWIPYSDRANVLELTYWDAAENYSKQTFQMYSHDYETTTEEVRVKSVPLYGCTNRDMAIKYGKYVLNINRYLTMKAGWTSDVDAIGCVPGDIIEIGHDVPQWGYSGRVVASTNNTVTLDRLVTMQPGTTYKIVVRHNATDTREEKTIAAVAEETETDVLTLASGTWTTNPAQYTNYSFGESGKVTKLARVYQISKAQNQRCIIRALEYNADVYSDTASIGIIESESSFVGVSGLRAEECYIPTREGIGTPYVLLTWRGQALKWNVYIKEPLNSSWRFLDYVTTPQYRVKNLNPGITYQFSVSEGDNPGIYTTSIAYSGIPTAPGDPTNLDASIIGEAVVLTWTESDEVTNTGHNIYLDGNLIAANIQGNRYVYHGALTAGNYTFTVKTVDPYGQLSSAAQDVLTVMSPATPEPSYDSNNEMVTISWQNCTTSLPIAYYLINGTDRVDTTTYLVRVNWTGTQAFTIKAVDIAGNQSVQASLNVTIVTITAVTAISPVPLTYAVRLDLTYNSFDTFAAVEVWSSLVNDRPGAKKVGETASTFFTHTGLGLVETRYYWTRIRDIYGSYGAWYPSSAIAGQAGSTSTDPDDYLTILEASITESQLYETLNNRINLLDTTEFVLDPDIIEPNIVNGLVGAWEGLSVVAGSHHDRIGTAEADVSVLETDNGLIKAQFTVKLNANGHVAGLGLMVSEESPSEMIIIADKFAIINPSIPGSPAAWSSTSSYNSGDYVTHNGSTHRCIQSYTYPPAKTPGVDTAYWQNEVFAPFIVGNVNGVSTVGINGNMIVDGTIIARHIAAQSIQASMYKELRQTYVFTGDDSLDASYPYILPFKIATELNTVVSVKVSFKVLPFRAYSTGVPSGGGTTSGSSSTEHSHTIPIVGPLSGTEWQLVYNVTQDKLTAGYSGWGGTGLPSSGASSTEHSHTTPNHTHSLSFGIYEESNSPTLHFHVDNGSGYGAASGNYTTDQLDIDITSQISGSGWKAIKFETTTRCRISVIVECKIDIDA